MTKGEKRTAAENLVFGSVYAQSAQTLQHLGSRYVIVGHSESRKAGDTDAIVARKLARALAAGLTPVLCVGEPLAVRRRGAHVAFVRKQLRGALRGVQSERVFIVYEPVWAISKAGKGTPCPPREAFAMERALRPVLSRSTILLYGGSVTPDTIRSYVDDRHFRGALVGHASTTAAGLAEMAKAIL